MKKYTFLITGTSSFAGSSVAQYLCTGGHEVIGITRDRNSGNLNSLLKMRNFTIAEGDLLNELRIDRSIDAVFHAAAQSPNRGATVGDYIKNHVIATQRVIDFAIEHEIKKIIFCSSVLVFGKVREEVVSETSPIIDPSLQGICKRLGELLLQERSKEIASIAIRLPGIVGKGAHNIWLRKVLENALRNEDVQIFNPHAPFNNVIFIDDLSRFVEVLTEKEWNGYECVTIASEEPIPINEAVRIIVSSVGSKSRIFEKEQAGKSYTISIERAKNIFGFCPRKTKEAIESYCKNY